MSRTSIPDRLRGVARLLAAVVLSGAMIAAAVGPAVGATADARAGILNIAA